MNNQQEEFDNLRKKNEELSKELENLRLLYKKECLLQTVFDEIPHGVMVIDQDENIRMINKAGASMMGFSDTRELENTSFLGKIDFPDPESSPIEDNPGSPFSTECLLTHKSGKKVPILKTGTTIQFGDEQALLETFIDLSDRKKKIGELTETKRRFTTLRDNLPGMVFRGRNAHDWRMEFISDGGIDLTAYWPDALIANKLLSYNDLIVPEDRDRIWNEVQSGLIVNKPYTIEYRIKCADGKFKWVWEKGKRITNESDNSISIEGFISDISDYKYAELVQKALFEISKTTYTSINIDEVFQSIHYNLGMIIDVENFYLAMYDENTDTITLPFQVDAKDKFEVFPAGKTITAYVIKSKTPLLATPDIIRKLTDAGEIEIVGTPSKVWLGVPLIVDGKVIGVIAVQSYTDPEQYTNLDLELLKFVAGHIASTIAKKGAEESLQKEKAYLDQLFEGSLEAIIMTDLDGKVLKVNSAFLNLFGFTMNEVLDHKVDDLIADPGNREESRKITRDIPEGITNKTDTRRSHKDGHRIDVSILVSPITIQESIIGCYAIYRYIGDYKRIEKSLIAAKEKAEGSDRLKSAFLANMSHEIRTPMNAILGFSALLSEPDLSEADQAEFIQIIKERGNDLMRIIDDIIDIAKIESGQIKIDIKECQLNDLMDSLVVTLNEVKRKTNKTKIALNCLPGSSDPDFTILTDANRLRQIMTNLIENSLKFTDEGSVEFGYTLKNIESSPHIEFFVRDTGIGIPKEMHDIVFERFRQVDDTATRKYGGAGLGLTISRNLAHLLDGRISLESDWGKGTTFYILFPLLGNFTKLEEPVVEKTVDLREHKWDNKSILVVEDEESNFMLLERLLKRTGAKITWVKNGAEAVEICQTQPFDLVLMDVRMPVMDGYEATMALKREHKSLPVIAQTAYALKGEREKSIAAGCDRYISKPIDTHVFLSILGEYLNE